MISTFPLSWWWDNSPFQLLIIFFLRGVACSNYSPLVRKGRRHLWQLAAVCKLADAVFNFLLFYTLWCYLPSCSCSLLLLLCEVPKPLSYPTGPYFVVLYLCTEIRRKSQSPLIIEDRFYELTLCGPSSHLDHSCSSWYSSIHTKNFLFFLLQDKMVCVHVTHCLIHHQYPLSTPKKYIVLTLNFYL